MDAELMLYIAGALVALIIVVWLLLKLIAAPSHEDRYARTGLDEVRRMDWREFEHFLGHLFRQLGYEATVTQASGDFGVDVLLTAPDGTKIAVQAKHWQGDVGVEHVLKTVGGAVHYGCQQAMVVTTSGYTPAAREASRTTGCQLWGPEELVAAMERAGIGAGARRAAAAGAQAPLARPAQKPGGLPAPRPAPVPVQGPAPASAARAVTPIAQGAPPAPQAETPRCPKCGVPMMARIAAGKPIWLCCRFPQCNGADLQRLP
jgi:HJR/Mrr/RecB family endonuclease